MNNPKNAIEVNNITKSFKVYFDKGNTIKEKMVSSKRRRFENRQVLNGMSFQVKKGEAIGLIGQNGCGKSTTLKLLTRIMYPDTGTISIEGRVSSLIELGAGFHPDMTGKENVFINASIFGLTKKEINQRLNDIIAFSELENYIDNPVRTYSSGMYMRLAFSIAINVDADVLLIDEILAVGDANFQAKCFNKLREIKSQGTTIVIVSHSLEQIEQICERSIWIHNGNIHAEGCPRDVHPEYLDFMGQKRQKIAEMEAERRQEKKEEQKKETIHEENTVKNMLSSHEQREIDKVKKRWGNQNAQITDIKLYNRVGKEQLVFAVGEYIKIDLEYKVYEKVEDAVIGIGIFRNDGVHCYGTNTRIDGEEKFQLDKDGKVSIELENLNLLAGKYKLDFALESGAGIPIDYFREAVEIEIYSTRNDVGVCRIAHQWKI